MNQQVGFVPVQTNMGVMMQQVVNTQYHQTITTHTFTRVDPGEYEGPMDDEGRRDGYGKCNWTDGSKYAGRWKKGMREGDKGTFTDSSGNTYEGPWDDDIRVGSGTMRYKSGKCVVGVWEKDRLNGQGTIQLPGKKPVDVIFKEDIIIESKPSVT